jgi:N-acetylglucosamine-6-sulfatase
LTDKAVAFIESTPTDQPFFLEVSPRNPHEPILPAPRHRNLAVPDVTLPPNFDEADVRDKPAWVRALPRVAEGPALTSNRREMRAMRSVDESLQAIVEAIAARGQLDNTVIVVTTDNGVSRGSHRFEKKICPYEECITGPLWVRYPGAAVADVAELVSNIDLAPTLGQLTGVTAGIPQDGVSLVPLLEGTATAWRSDVLITWRSDGTSIPPYWGVRTAEWKYVEYATGERELYDLANDPYELTNLVRDPSYMSVRLDMRERLGALRYRADHRLPSWP